MFRLLIAALFFLAPTLVVAAVFGDLSGVYGDPLHMDETCKSSPQHIVFSQNNQRGAVQVYSDQFGPDLYLATELAFDLLRTTPGGIEIIFDEEETHTAAGEPAVWEFRVLDDPNGYCWHRVDWPDKRCINTVNSCEGPMIS